MAALCPIPRGQCQFLGQTTFVGQPLAGGFVYFYRAGSLDTFQDTFTDSSGNIPNDNPVELDAAGSANIWLSADLYQVRLTDADGVEQWVVDNVSAIDLNTYATETNYGLVEFATVAETVAGIINDKATHPEGVKAAIRFDNNPFMTAFVPDDTIQMTDSNNSDDNARIRADDFETQLKADLEGWVNGLIAAAGGGGGGGGGTANTGVIADFDYQEFISDDFIDAHIPRSSVPTTSDGTLILTSTITPKVIGNKLYISVKGIAIPEAATVQPALTVFVNDAFLKGSIENPEGSSNAACIAFDCEYTTTALTPITIKVYAGSFTNARYKFYNASGGTPLNSILWGTGGMGATLSVFEVGLPGDNLAIISDTTGVTGADRINNIISLTQAEYDAIGSPDANTMYVIVG